MSILVVGSVAYDDLETPFGKKERVLGGAATHFSASASFFTPVRLVGVVGSDFDQQQIAFLKERNVDLTGLQVQADGKTFHWKGRYGYDLNEAQTLETHLNVFAQFKPILPKNFQESPYVFLANIDPELQFNVLEQVKAPKWIAMDTMNFWIQGKLEALKRTLKKVDILFVNESEARQLTKEHNLVKAAKKVLEWGPKIVVIKRGEYGSMLFSDSLTFWAPGYPLEDIKDPTGAGDSFAGGFLGYLATHKGDMSEPNLKRAVICGSVMASFQVEDFGLDRMRLLNKKEINERFQAFKTLSHFEETIIL
ncbi:MAG: sugar kinase [Deltaproteobacteria bacterium RIFCSPLOWO2_01_44_7]|nr:MAG: sugar kinase [Deltaproteobacteria bacterium RIFCSPHIGHO2_01_FULL_43_49]OGQ15325.1 MAG: sugar kinase [Deltaproteobacteria bacterium RIFCSPHIGHO2_02_FULL_44_53]OGQ27183.1 MAG: sugar kinase [Deltaproteobacteria bacterium RIFCSPHIGHO2_12_FULL_44_21]OGQ31841.1 MAG: sugar kinase [Deltaproteobacteria bacterium RIFCSPLOWO2_01_FULL_45_74]OGQ38098.1 MAG: sugar kinase [Deltaproteobacteria bacterium RIFCSPLOWO2_01_44_7]OGQ43044.1 MAG: sugar kinase [Deltaproteobacteria bacterium RIFCSPLOWO2_02_FULL